MPCRFCPCLFVAPAIGAAFMLGAAQPATQPKQPEKPSAPKEPSTKPTTVTPKQPEKKPATATGEKADPYVLGFKMKRIEGTEEDLAKYKGKVVAIVNVASKCGYTPQYTALEAMYEELKDKGFVILAFPANNFGGQEPGTNQEIASSCASTYHITFPMFEKISVKGEDQHALYKKLTAQPAPIGGDPKWNFTKFVVDQKGNVVARYDAKGDGSDRTKLEPDFVKKVHELLGIKDEPKKDTRPPASGS